LLPYETSQIILNQPDNTYLHFREIIDFISGMTDSHALSLYRRIKGISM
jgi:dGTPase